MIGRLKAACGYEYTTKLQVMFTDIATSREQLAKFREQKDSKATAKLPFDFSVMVLATNAWPLQAPTTNFLAPPALATAEALFNKFYIGQFKGRKLSWLHQLGKAEVRARYTQRALGYVMQCSSHQCAILLLFDGSAENRDKTSSKDGNDWLTAEQIQTTTLLNDAAARAALLALVKTQVFNNVCETIAM